MFVPFTIEAAHRKSGVTKSQKKKMMEFINLHFPKHDRVDGNVIVKTDSVFQGRNKDGVEIEKHYMRLVGFDPISKLNDWMPKIVWHKRNNYYIGANTFSGMDTKSEEVLSFNNIVVDCDLHNYVFTPEDILKRANKLGDFIEEVWNASDLPKINDIVLTGRGAQLWIATNSLTYKYVRIYKAVVAWICKEMKKRLKADPFLKDFEVDFGASGNPAGLFRMPGTFNTYARTWTQFRHLSDERLDLFEFYNNVISPRDPDKKTGRKAYKPKSAEGLLNYNFKGIDRVNFFMGLQKVRAENASAGNEERDKQLFVLYNVCRYNDLMSHSEAMEYVFKMNSNFIEPLPEHQILSYLSSSIRKVYTLGWDYTVEFLDIQEEEVLAVLEMGEVKHSYPKKKSQNKRHFATEEQKQKAIELNKKRKSMSEIAKAIGMTVGWVSIFFKENGILPEVAKRKIRIRKALERGDSIKKIAKREKMTEHQIYKHYHDWMDEKENAEKEAKQKAIEEEQRKKEEEEAKKQEEKEKEKKAEIEKLKTEILMYIKQKSRRIGTEFRIGPEEVHQGLENIRPVIKLQEVMMKLFYRGIHPVKIEKMLDATLITTLKDKLFDEICGGETQFRNDLENYVKKYRGETVLGILRRNFRCMREQMLSLEEDYLVDQMKDYISKTDSSGGTNAVKERLQMWVKDNKEKIRVTERIVKKCINRAAKCIQLRIRGKRNRRAKKRMAEVCHA